jgi:hypothetical protein
MKLGDPQGLLLTESSPGSVLVSKTAQQGMMAKRGLITVAVTKNFIQYIRILLCGSICSANLPGKHGGVKYRLCLLPFQLKGLP